MKRALSIALLVLGGLPMLAYPVLLMLGIPAVFGESPRPEPLWRILAARAAAGALLLYPLVFALCTWCALSRRNPLALRWNWRTLAWSIGPLAYLLVAVALILLWFFLEEYGVRG